MTESGLDFLFHPKSVAFVGVSSDPSRRTPAGTYLHDYIESGFPGNLYPVGQGGGEISGLKIYKSLKDIPGSVDYVVVGIPARSISGLLDEGAAKGVKAMHLFTAGFSETGSDEGRNLEQEMIAKARRLGIRILGPNCMGIYCPKTSMTFSRSFPNQKAFTMESGTLGFIAQSGGNSIHCVTEAIKRKVLFSKAISYGNGTDINECDFLEYFTNDPDTSMIGAYIEGVKGGKRFIEVLKKTASKKPVIIYKAGLSEGGSRTAASHTASLSGSAEVWKSLLKQAGAVQVHSIEEIVDMALLFLKMPFPKGRNIGLVGSGGGPSVHAADECYNAGLIMPQLNSENRRRLKQLTETDAGYILGNPTDVLTRSELMSEATKIVA
ncbi:MAG: CoA-binding protein, partial [Dehalococcoidales bacterium]|nr:CoA-binding protein [Dehalococcoidales bacterium]